LEQIVNVEVIVGMKKPLLSITPTLTQDILKITNVSIVTSILALSLMVMVDFPPIKKWGEVMTSLTLLINATLECSCNWKISHCMVGGRPNEIS